MFVALGIAIAYFLDFGLSFTGAGPLAWRLPIACQLLMAILVSILVIGLPETPRWLIQQGRIDEAMEVMCKVYNLPLTDEYVISEKEGILNAVALEQAKPFQWAHLLEKDPLQTSWRIFLACLVLFMNQVNLYYLLPLPNLRS